MARVVLAPIMTLAVAALLAGCGGSPATQAEIAAQVSAAREPAEVRAGNLLLRASIAPTVDMGSTVAQRYGITPGPRTVLLLVSLHRVDGTDEVPIVTTPSAGVRDLRGVRSQVALREVRYDDFIEYVGEVRVTPPDTLSFDISADLGSDKTIELRFNRDVFPPGRR